jgi:hypothetical protein
MDVCHASANKMECAKSDAQAAYPVVLLDSVGDRLVVAAVAAVMAAALLAACLTVPPALATLLRTLATPAVVAAAGLPACLAAPQALMTPPQTLMMPAARALAATAQFVTSKVIQSRA